MLTRSTEDYLKQIYHLQASGEKANTGTLASLLGISPASVSEMVGRLSAEGWITNQPYHGFQLTKKGERIAVNLVRKHRLIEVFLQQHLKYEWDEVHSEAERLEHVISDTFVNKLEEYLGFPKYDPHGDPIPDKNGKILHTHYRLLSKSDAGKDYIDEALFAKMRIRLEYHSYRHPVYSQLHGEFVPYLSVIDLLFNHGGESLEILTHQRAAT